MILGLIAVALLTFATNDRALHTDYDDLMNALNGGGATASRVRGLLGYLGRAFHYSPSHLIVLALIFLVLAAVEATEAVGLWWNMRWAEYLTFVVTTLFIPYEIYELVLRVSILKVVALVLNVAVVAYLLWAKRLFGLRGGTPPRWSASAGSVAGRPSRTPSPACRCPRRARPGAVAVHPFGAARGKGSGW